MRCTSLAQRLSLVLAVGVACCVGEPSRAWSAEAAERSEATASETDEEFRHGDWPFRPPVRPAVPKVRGNAWVRNPIDAFILRDLEKLGLTPNDAADRLTLLRRVTFDLTGLPPTVEEQRAFLADKSPDAYEKIVDRLLASPHYGERFAQHWLDLVRYAETDGFNADGHRPMAHKYRDYVIKALNDDLPYDRFIAQQLAGDELEPDNPQALVATGLNRLYPDEWNAGDLRLRRQEILDDITDTTGLVFLGLTMGCAQCHDHKFDEILQADYYRLQAFFQPMLPCDDMVLATPAEKAEYQRQFRQWEEKTREIRRAIDELVKPAEERYIRSRAAKYDKEIQDAIFTPDEKRTAYQKQIVYQARAYITKEADAGVKSLKGEAKERYDALVKKLATFDELKPKPLPVGMGITDAGREAPPTFLLATGNFRKPLEPVDPGFPQFLGAYSANIEPKSTAPESTGRRSALAEWLARGDHPLTSRVMVNRLWQYHFVQGIVASSNDFGTMGDVPTHRELLDWLAVEFVESGWSFKHMHRLMVTSNAYRQSSAVLPDDPRHAATQAKDPANQKLWHFRRRRLEGESIRDAMLLVSGELNRRMFGPSAKPELPAKISSQQWTPDAKPEDRNRRSIYVLAKRNLRYPLFDAFDFPDMHHSTPRRAVTITAPQALLLINSEFSVDRARHWAGRLLEQAPNDDAALVAAAYEQAFARAATAEEISAAVSFIATVAADEASVSKELSPEPAPKNVPPARAAAVVDFCHALFNCNEFVYVD